VLGLVWHRFNDCFSYDPQSFCYHCASFQGHCTKHTVPSSSARIFDSLGLISSIILVSKILLQEIWSLGVDWDTKLPEKTEVGRLDPWFVALVESQNSSIPEVNFENIEYLPSSTKVYKMKRGVRQLVYCTLKNSNIVNNLSPLFTAPCRYGRL
jgi:Pao retrotransposon peptidase